MDNVCLCEAPRIKAKFRRTWECTICGKPEQPNTAEAAHPAPATVEMREALDIATKALERIAGVTGSPASVASHALRGMSAALAPATEGR